MRFHLGVNKPLGAHHLGSVNVEVSHKTGGRWAYEDRTTVLRSGDAVYYWLQVTVAGETYERAGSHVVQGERRRPIQQDTGRSRRYINTFNPHTTTLKLAAPLF